MAKNGNTLRSRFAGSDKVDDDQMAEALESRLAESESVVYQLTSSGGITHERDGEKRAKGGGASGTILAATDRKLVFVLDTSESIETADIRYPDVKDIEESGIVRTKLSVTVWWRGTFRFSPRESDTASKVVDFVSDASETWQRAITALKDARQHVATLPEYITEGETIDAREARKAAREQIETANEWASSAQESVRDAIENRIADVERDLARTRAQAYTERAGDLSTRGRALSDARKYDDAYATLRRAKSHAETALAIAIREGFDMSSTVGAQKNDIEEQLVRLQETPLDRAEEALDRALDADNPRLAVLAWEQAFDHYRDALTAGWGTDARFDGDTEALRMQIEWIVATLIELRWELADDHDRRGDRHSDDGESELARAHYQAACDHLSVAADLASTYQAGDADAIRTWSEWIGAKLD